QASSSRKMIEQVSSVITRRKALSLATLLLCTATLGLAWTASANNTKRRTVSALTPKPSAPLAPFSSITVNSTADNTTAGNGQCTLREAIANANSNSDTTGGDCPTGNGTDTIQFSVTGTISLTNGELALSDSVNISGPGANQLTIQRDNGAPNSRIFS